MIDCLVDLNRRLVLQVGLLAPSYRNRAANLNERASQVAECDDLLGLNKICHVAFIVRSTNIKSLISRI